MNTKELAEVSLPLLFVDGFFNKGPDCVCQALQHDHIPIITGGVAITPSLSLLSLFADHLERTASLLVMLQSWYYVCQNYTGPYRTKLAEVGLSVNATVCCTNCGVQSD